MEQEEDFSASHEADIFIEIIVASMLQNTINQ